MTFGLQNTEGTSVLELFLHYIIGKHVGFSRNSLKKNLYLSNYRIQKLIKNGK